MNALHPTIIKQPGLFLIILGCEKCKEIRECVHIINTSVCFH